MAGSRTAPYLQALLANFTIPIQIVTRFLVLRKRPTFLKGCCAGAVLLAEFVCLIPTIFPELESSKSHQEEGGSKGILWPLCMVLSQIPYALCNALMERTVQNKEQSSQPGHSQSQGNSQLNLVFFLFWWNLFQLITVVAMFWVDLIPGFGTSANLRAFGESLWFNLRCLFGGAGCGPPVVVLGWLLCWVAAVSGVGFSGLMRYSEGANFVVIVLMLRTPIVFIFWTMFEEQPFYWHPQAHLSTWLSIGGIVVMVPAIIVYNRAPPEYVSVQRRSVMSEEEQKGLLEDVDYTNPINYGTHDTLSKES